MNTVGLTLLGWLALWGVVAFVLFAWDKARARAGAGGAGRIPEKRLLAVMWIGGAVGAAAAMAILRHKTRKTLFVLSAFVAAGAHLALLLWLGVP